MHGSLLQYLTRIFVLAVLIAGLSGQAAADPEADRAAISEIWVEYAASLNAGDAARWSALWTGDGIQMPPDEPAVVGVERIRARAAAALAQFRYDMTVTNHEIGLAGDLAFSRGAYSLTMTPFAGGEPELIDGKFMTIHRRQPDGSWRIHRDIFNSNVPPVSE